MSRVARHLLLELFGCPARLLDDVQALRALLRRAAQSSGARVVADVFHPFAPHGVTGVVLIEESHLSVHTWPESGYAALDFYTCGATDSELAVELIASELGAERVELLEVTRGAEPDATLRTARRSRR